MSRLTHQAPLMKPIKFAFPKSTLSLLQRVRIGERLPSVVCDTKSVSKVNKFHLGSKHRKMKIDDINFSPELSQRHWMF